MDQNEVSYKRGLPFYIAGFASIAAGLFYLSGYSVSSWYRTLSGILAFIAAGAMLYLGWLMHMGMDSRDSDNGGGGGGRIILDKPA